MAAFPRKRGSYTFCSNPLIKSQIDYNSRDKSVNGPKIAHVGT